MTPIPLSVLSLLACLAMPLAAAEPPWSLAPLELPELPASAETTDSPIDAFVRDRLHANGLDFSPPADRATWLRRVTFDLTGLPPTPEELQQFLDDESPDTFERIVNRLLASPRYGERWARHWMDVARYAETQGHDEDAIREHAWPYRDWLIRALNDDLPYAEFVRLQVAGDVLAPDDPWATAATGFLAAGPWDGSSQMGIQDGTIDKKIAQYLDRDDMLSATMSAFTSTTVHCARCHDHKFDPVPLEDYYALQAVFAGIDKVDRPFEPDPQSARKRSQLEHKLRQLRDGSLPVAHLDQDDVQGASAKWADALNEKLREWFALAPVSVHSENGTPHEILADDSILFDGTPPQKDTYTIAGKTTGKRLTALQLEVLTDPSLPHDGPGRAPNGNLHLSEITVQVNGKPVQIREASADFNQDGWEAGKAIDGKPETAWGIHPQEGTPHRAVFVFDSPLEVSSGSEVTVVLAQLHGGSHLIGRPRLSLTGAAEPELHEPLPAELATIVATLQSERSLEQRRALARTWLLQETTRQLAALPPPGKVFAVASDFEAMGNFKPAGQPREIHVLDRGDVRSPLAVAEPGALSCLPGLPARFDLDDPNDEGSRRAALAHWLAHHDNVLTWRSIVNRVWHYHFGRGIVETPNDFGTMGGTPTHPELLDWLAVTFRERGGSLKSLHKQIVLSATYRQSSADRPAGLAIDPENRLLWRMNRHRLDADCIRDAVLALSGKLDLTMGGPSARHFTTSKGVHITPNVHYREFDPDHPANFRRSVYRFVFRTVPDPLMQALDCPDGSQVAARRETSTTALQALALLNNRFLVRQSEHLAARLRENNETLDQQITELLLRAWSRIPEAGELKSVRAFARAHGLANACRVILNSSEFLYAQ